MQFGVLLDHQYDKGDDVQSRIPELIDFVETIRDLGFDSVFGIHHYLSTLRTFQPMTLLARLLPHTGTMNVGTGVLIVPLVSPVHHAEEVASLDQLSGGRLIFGVGAGYRENEFAAFDVPLGERFGRMWESIEVIQRLWTGEPVDHDGRYFTLVGAECSILPLQRSGPPIWVGSGSSKVIEHIGREGLPWLAAGNAKRNWVLGNMKTYRDTMVASGHALGNRTYPIHRDLCIGDSEDDAYASVVAYVRRSYVEYAPFGMEWMGTNFADVTRKAGIFGNPEEVVAKLRDFIEAGFNHFVFRVQWLGCPNEISVRTLERFAREVAPELRRLAVSAG
jgi:alkanesulfonate monooxygenase SsuD/methylene tetrahydromethanopterin reductase-like flavin-dependent oxidoreductase (luciferase family)